MNELNSPVTRKSFQNQTELSRFSVGRIPFIPSLLILHMLIQLVTEHVKALKSDQRSHTGCREVEKKEGTLSFVLILVADFTAPSSKSEAEKENSSGTWMVF